MKTSDQQNKKKNNINVSPGSTPAPGVGSDYVMKLLTLGVTILAIFMSLYGYSITNIINTRITETLHMQINMKDDMVEMKVKLNILYNAHNININDLNYNTSDRDR